MTQTILVGTTHEDLMGPKRLEKMLAYFQPDIICSEATPEIARGVILEHEEHCKLLAMLNDEEVPVRYTAEQAERLKLELLHRQYEIWVPESYRKSNQCSIEYIDIADCKKILEDMMIAEKIYHFANCLNLLEILESFHLPGDFVINGSVEKYQARISKRYENQIDFGKIQSVYGEQLAKRVTIERDANFAAQVRRLKQENPEARIMTVLGLAHIFGDYAGNTYELLKDLNPRRIKLNEADDLT